MRYQADVQAGTIARDGEQWPIVNGVVECPTDVAADLGLQPVGDAPAAAASGETGHQGSGESGGADDDVKKLLEGHAAAVIAVVNGVDDAAQLAKVNAAELAGKKRSTVLKAIAERLEALAQAAAGGETGNGQE